MVIAFLADILDGFSYFRKRLKDHVILIVWTVIALTLTSYLSTNKIVLGEKVCKTTVIRANYMMHKIPECDIIEGSLTITNVNFSTINFDKISPLREITEYLLIYRVYHLESLEALFPNLAVIRGEALFGGYALIVHENWDLRELGLTSMVSILKGSVRITKNPVLCYVHTVNWFYLLPNMTRQHFVLRNNVNQNHCPLCYDSNNNTDVANNSNFNVARKSHCWGHNKYQKICPNGCERGSCNSKGECCHRECLSDCSDPQKPKCEICKTLIHDGMCVQSCDIHSYKLANRRCVSDSTCEREGYLPHDGKCSKNCPPGWLGKNGRCHRCTDSCVEKPCNGGTIRTAKDAELFHNCTHINGAIDIQLVEKASYIIGELEKHLSSIVEIKGFLRVRNSPQLTSLSFFKNLTRIRGENLADQNTYALIVTENYHLENIWNKNQTVEIDKGIMSFHFNPKLCYEKIEAIASSIKNEVGRKIDSNDVSPHSNGDGVVCGPNLTNLTVTVEAVNATAVRIKVTPLSYEDKRIFLGYLYYYTEALEQDLSAFDVRHGCGYDRWKVEVDLSKNVRHIIRNLKPHTQYGFFVKTFTVPNAHVQKEAYSQVSYFKTLSWKPGPISKFYADVRNDTEIALHWWPPTKPNGLIKYYLLQIRNNIPIDEHRDIEARNLLVAEDSIEPEYDNVEVEVYNKKLMDTKLNITLYCQCSEQDYWRGFTPMHHQYYDALEVLFEDAVADFVFISTDANEAHPKNDTDSRTMTNSQKQELWNRRMEEEERKALKEFDTGTDDFPIILPQKECQFGRYQGKKVNVEADSHNVFPNMIILEGHIHKHVLQSLDPNTRYRFSIRACVENDFKMCGPETILNVTTPNTLVFPIN